MNVYRVCTFVETGNNYRQVFAAAEHTDAIDTIEYFDGKPLRKAPPRVTLRLDRPKLPPGDFLHFGASKVLLPGPRAMNAVGELLRQSGQLFPLKVKGLKHEYQLLNVTRLLKDVLDKKKSAYRKMRTYKQLEKPAFHASRIPADVQLFKIPQNFGIVIYCVERTGKVADGEFKALVEKHKLTGVEFGLVWSDGKSPTKGTAKAAAKANGSDTPLAADIAKDVKLSIRRGAQTVGVKASAAPLEIQRAIRTAIDDISARKVTLSKRAAQDFAVNVGCLWGQTVCDAAKWQWCFAKIGKSKSANLAVAAPDRSYIVTPMQFIQSKLSGGENTSMLLFNMIRDGLPSRQPNTYQHIG